MTTERGIGPHSPHGTPAPDELAAGPLTIRSRLAAAVAPPMFELIDISAYQPRGDLRKVAASGVVGVYLRTTIGTSVDQSYAMHRADVRAAALASGSYGVIIENLDPVVQAVLFARTRGVDDELPYFLDLERGTLKEPDAAYLWCKTTREITGVIPIVYTSQWWWQGFGGDLASHPLSQFPLMVSDYSGHNPPLMPRAWSDYVIHQYTGTGRVPGFDVNVDRSRCRLSVKDLAKLCRPIPPPSPVPVPVPSPPPPSSAPAPTPDSPPSAPFCGPGQVEPSDPPQEQ